MRRWFSRSRDRMHLAGCLCSGPLDHQWTVLFLQSSISTHIHQIDTETDTLMPTENIDKYGNRTMNKYRKNIFSMYSLHLFIQAVDTFVFYFVPFVLLSDRSFNYMKDWRTDRVSGWVKMMVYHCCAFIFKLFIKAHGTTLLDWTTFSHYPHGHDRVTSHRLHLSLGGTVNIST